MEHQRPARPGIQSSSQQDAARLRLAFRRTIAFCAIIWLVMLVAWLFDLPVNRLGIYPEKLSSVTGILFAPLIHGSWKHLVSNTGAVIVLGTALLYLYPRSARIVIPATWILPGIGVWFYGRAGFHIGASGMTFGVAFFLFTVGVLRRDRPAMAIAMLVFFLYGSMIWGLFPRMPGISFEYHMGGAAAGVLLAVLLRHTDPPPPVKHYDWEDEDLSDIDQPQQ